MEREEPPSHPSPAAAEASYHLGEVSAKLDQVLEELRDLRSKSDAPAGRLEAAAERLEATAQLLEGTAEEDDSIEEVSVPPPQLPPVTVVTEPAPTTGASLPLEARKRTLGMLHGW